MEDKYISKALAKKLYIHRKQVPEIPITSETKWIDDYIPLHTFAQLKETFDKDPILSVNVSYRNAKWETSFSNIPWFYIHNGKKYSSFNHSYKQAYEGIVSEMIDTIGWFIYPDYEEEE